MSNLVEVLVWAFPGRQWSVPDNGTAHDVEWLDGSGPSPDEVEAARLPYRKSVLTQATKNECARRITARYPIHKQLQGEHDQSWIDAMTAHYEMKKLEIAGLADLPACEAYDIGAGWPHDGGLHGTDSMVYEEQAEPDDVADDNISDFDGGIDSGPVPDVESTDDDSADWGSLDLSDSGGGLAPFEVVEGNEQTEVTTGEIPAPEIDATSLEHPAHAEIEPEPEPTPSFGGVLIQGDVLKTAKMERSWLVDLKEDDLISRYKVAENEARLAVLNSMAIGAKEGSLPALTEAEAVEFQGLSVFSAWLAAVQAHARNLRKAIKQAPDEASIAGVDIDAGWPVA